MLGREMLTQRGAAHCVACVVVVFFCPGSEAAVRLSDIFITTFTLEVVCIESDMDVRAVSLIQARERPKAEGRGPLEGRNQRYLP